MKTFNFSSLLNCIVFGLLSIHVSACSAHKQNIITPPSPPPLPLTEDQPKGFPKIRFDSVEYKLGNVVEGNVVPRELFFTNVGTSNLEISLVTSCECTTVDWPVLPIKPGQRSSLKIKYNSKDKKGIQHTDIDITANTEKPLTIIHFSVIVDKK